MGTEQQGSIDDLDVLNRGSPQRLSGEHVDGPKNAASKLVQHPERVGGEQLGGDARTVDPLTDVGRGVLGRGGRELDLGREPGEQRAMHPEL